MIGILSGRVLDASTPGRVTVYVHSIGYEVEVPVAWEAHPNESAEVWVHEHSSEYGRTLFGFRSLGARDLFRALLKVHDVGPRTAFEVYGAFEPRVFAEAVLGKRTDILRAVKGIGAKTAERIIAEFPAALAKAWAPDFEPAKAAPAMPNVRAVNLSARHPLEADLLPALLGLSYDKKKALAALAMVPHSAEQQEAIVLAIKALSPAAQKL